MLAVRTFTSQTSVSPHKVKKVENLLRTFRQLSAKQLNRNWGSGKVGVQFGAVSDRADVIRLVLIIAHRAAWPWKSFEVEVHNEFIFVSLLGGFSLLIGPTL